MSHVDPAVCATALEAAHAEIRESMNDFTASHFHCLGGRLGSGMGALLEALWAFHARAALNRRLPGEYEVAWMVDNAYNDFAIVDAEQSWDPETRGGEILRIEAKSMNLEADETKGHFDALQSEIGEQDLLLALVWRWVPLDDRQQVVFPQVRGEFLGSAIEVARLRDAMHLARGGSFVSAETCPDHCDPATCRHVGEPLNAAGVRERRFGPDAARGARVSSAANFGGLKRMIAGRGTDAQTVLAEQVEHSTRKRYVEFIRSFPALPR